MYKINSIIFKTASEHFVILACMSVEREHEYPCLHGMPSPKFRVCDARFGSVCYVLLVFFHISYIARSIILLRAKLPLPDGKA